MFSLKFLFKTTNEMDEKSIENKSEFIFELKVSVKDKIISNLNRQLSIYLSNIKLTDKLKAKLIKENCNLVAILNHLPEKLTNSEKDEQNIGDLLKRLDLNLSNVANKLNLVDKNNDLIRTLLLNPIDESSTLLVQNEELLKSEFKKEEKDEDKINLDQKSIENKGNYYLDEKADITHINQTIPSHLKMKNCVFKFQISNFKRFFESGSYYFGNTFKWCNHHWYFAAYSRATNLVGLKFKSLSVFLQCQNLTTAFIQVNADCTLVNQTVGNKNKTRSFSHKFFKSQGFGWPSFIDYNKLCNGFVIDDKLIFQISLWSM